MFRLIYYELSKIWQKRSFVLAISVLFLVHLFVLWYVSLPDEETPPLSAYKKIQSELTGKSEEEKADFIKKQKEKMDGVLFVRDILAMQGFHNTMGNALAKQEMQNNPGKFETYYSLYQSGEYLMFTDTLEQESALTDEIYEEWKKVSGYGDYLASIQSNKDRLAGISIFSRKDTESFGSRNLKKSAADYENLSAEGISFIPMAGLTSAMEWIWTDIFLFLSVMLFVASLIMEEKEKKIFFVTRSTKRGIFYSIFAKLAALFIQCSLLVVLFYLANFVYFGQSAGWPDFDVRLQSVAAYTESSLPISILVYVLLSLITKAVVLFGIGALLMFFCLLSKIAVLPFLAGTGIAGISMLLYLLIPADTVFAICKYLNPAGLLKTENIYGAYLNFNVFGYPLSRLNLSLPCMLVLCVAGISGCLFLFSRRQGFEVRKIQLPALLPFQPHTGVFRHELYKSLITNRVLILFVLFAGLFAYKSFGRTYTPSVAEQYYQDIMMELEGECTKEKEELILSEKKRYEEAQQKLEALSEKAAGKGIPSEAADAMRQKLNMTLSFYPAFQRVEEQYERVKNDGGEFVYDTGYLYLFGVWEDVLPEDFLLLMIGIILLAGGTVTMEYQTGMLHLLCASKVGKWKVFAHKFIICVMAASLITLVPVLCRAYGISGTYPMHSLSAAITNLSHYSEFAVPLPVGVFTLIFVLLQILSAVLAVCVTMAISMWRKNQAQTIFFSLLVLAIPTVFKLLGFEAAKWFSLYPLYHFLV